MKRATLVTALGMLLTGCFSMQAVYRHPETRQLEECTNSGDLFGAFIAMGLHASCKDKLEKQGYLKLAERPWGWTADQMSKRDA